jgi:predicted nucleic acid-binding protein
LKVYLDACCLGRLTDDQSQSRVRAEAEAVEHIMGMIRAGRATWVSSTILSIDVSRNPDPERRQDAETLLIFADEVIVPNPDTAERAREIEKQGFSTFDALYLASAEQAGADVFLTTDGVLLRRAGRTVPRLRLRVENPVLWYQEVRP